MATARVVAFDGGRSPGRGRAGRGSLAVAALVLVVVGGAMLAAGVGSVVGDAAASVARPFDGDAREVARDHHAAGDAEVVGLDGRDGRDGRDGLVGAAAGWGGVAAGARSGGSDGRSSIPAAITLDEVAAVPMVDRPGEAASDDWPSPTLVRRGSRLGAMAAGVLGPDPMPVPSDRLVDPVTTG